MISKNVDLMHNTNLRSLSIGNFNLRIVEAIAGPGSFLEIIQRISSPSFSHIEIDVIVESCADLIWLDCTRVADELNHPRFPELQKVCVNIRCESFSKMDEALGWVRREMSCLDNRGILFC
jgi:hypothetical protein